jgi:UDP-glucose 4-epimerase
MILITGSSGYIGSEIVNEFEKRNIKYIGIDSQIYSSPKNIVNKKKYIKIDISNSKIKNLIQKNKIETVIHCAALSYVLDAESNKSKYILNNITKTKKFINLCKKANIRNFIFLSSSNVYSEGPKTFSEKNFTNPINLYGKTKIIIEKYLRTKKFESLIILRLFNIVGLTKKFYVFKFNKENYQRLFFKLANVRLNFQINYQISNNKKIFPKRDFIDISDVSSVILRLLNKIKEKKIFDTFNLGSGESVSTMNICKKFNKNATFKFKKISKKELSVTKANINKIKKFLSWQPQVKIENSIKSTLKFIRYR